MFVLGGGTIIPWQLLPLYLEVDYIRYYMLMPEGTKIRASKLLQPTFGSYPLCL